MREAIRTRNCLCYELGSGQSGGTRKRRVGAAEPERESLHARTKELDSELSIGAGFSVQINWCSGCSMLTRRLLRHGSGTTRAVYVFRLICAVGQPSDFSRLGCGESERGVVSRRRGHREPGHVGDRSCPLFPREQTPDQELIWISMHPGRARERYLLARLCTGVQLWA
jgi:hypothetical protein